MGDTIARLTAALLAGRQGWPEEVQALLTRAEELFAEQSEFLASARCVPSSLTIGEAAPQHPGRFAKPPWHQSWHELP